MNYLKIDKESVVNGQGLRVVLWLSGCEHHCEGCQNRNTWNPNNGQLFFYDAQNEINEELSKEYINGITITGGDPLYKTNIKDVFVLVKHIKESFPQKTIWLYTGYTWEEIITDSEKFNIIQYCDVVVDGEYIVSQRDITLKWRGSNNQRVINVKESYRKGEVILYTE